jgi:Tfp pilus assembly protein PilZ
MPAGMLTTTAKRRIEFDDLLDIPPANDVDPSGPVLRGLSRWAMRATVGVDTEDYLYAGLSYDVAAGGIFVATHDQPPIGARIDVYVTTADGRERALSGIVRWVRDAALASDGLPAGCGIEWKGLPVEALRTFEALAAEREPLLWLAEVA